MTLSKIDPKQAWSMVLDQFQAEMPKASFDTWVRDTEFVSFEDGILTVGTTNTFASEWLTDRLTSTVNRMLTGMLNQPVTVRFVVLEFTEENEPLEDGLARDEKPESDNLPKVITLQAEYQSIYDEIVQPDHVIVVPGYFLRYIPMLGVELAWLYVGFRQAAYEAGASKKPGKKVSAPAKKVAYYAGMSPRSFWRWASKPTTWKLLCWLIKPVEEKARWHRGSDGRPHQSTRYYRVAMTMPLTPFDELSLRAWLFRKLSEGKRPLVIIQEALETPVDELLPWPEKMPSSDETGGEPHSVQDVLQAVCNPIAESEKTQFNELTDKLAEYLMPSRDLIFLTHYFVSHWLPRLGPGPGWFVTLMRDRCYLNRRTGEIRDEVRLEQGYAEAARWLGLKRVKTIWEWLRSADVAIFLREMDREIGTWEEAPRRIKVCLGEPMTDEDQDQANALLAESPLCAGVTHSNPENIEPIGASDSHSELLNDGAVGAIVTQREENDDVVIGVSDIHSEVNDDRAIGASVTHSDTNVEPAVGASCTHGNQQIGASVTHRDVKDEAAIGASCTLRNQQIGTSDSHSGASVTHSDANDESAVGASCIRSNQQIGASDSHNGASVTHSDTTVEPAIGASCTRGNQQIGASDSHSGATDTHRRGASVTHIGASVTHNGATGTIDWRDWHSLISLTPGFKHLDNTQTTSSANDSLYPDSASLEIKKGVVAVEWKLSDLLTLNRIGTKNQELLLGKGIRAQTFISWLLYAASRGGNGIRDPIGHAISRLIQDPSRGAGGAYERLAGLPANELTELLHRELNGQNPWNTDWRTAMDGAPRARLRALADQLGVSVPNSNGW